MGEAIPKSGRLGYTKASRPMGDFKNCPDCKGRGYFHCPCWPADCLCGQDEENCERCDATGLIDPDEEAHYEAMDEMYQRHAENRLHATERS